jgi:hypothetical protein
MKLSMNRQGPLIFLSEAGEEPEEKEKGTGGYY